MHPVRRQQQDVSATLKSLKKGNVCLHSSKEAEPLYKKARLDSDPQTASFTESDGQLGTSSSARTPFRVNKSGWIQLDTPSPHLAAQAPQRHSWPLFPEHQQQTLSVRGDPEHDPTASRQEASVPKEGYREAYFESPSALTSSPHDFSTVEVKKELSRLQALSQQLPSSDQATAFLASDQSCRQIEWPEASPGDCFQDSSPQELKTLYVTPRDLSSATQQSLESNRISKPEPVSEVPFQLAPGFALAADIKAVERQQREKPKSKLKRKLAEWDIPARVATVSF